MRISKIKLRLMMFILIFIISITNIAFADNFDVNEFDQTHESDTLKSVDFMSSGIGTVLNVVQIFAAGAAVIGLIVIGIKYLLAAPDGRASYRKAFLIYLFGMLLVTSGVEIIKDIASIVH